MESQVRTLSGLNVIAGLWLIISPFILHYTSTGNTWQQVILGVILAVLGLVRLGATNVTWPSWANVAIGIWMIIAPWVMRGVTGAAKWNQIILGIIVAILGYSSAEATLQYKHHHRA